MTVDAWVVGTFGQVYEVCWEGIQPYNIKNRDVYWRRYKIQETLYVGQWRLSSLQSRHLGTSHISPNYHQLPCHIFLNLNDGLSKMILVLGKARSHWEPNLGCKGAESPGWFDVLPKSSAWDMMHTQARCCDKAVNHQLPRAAAFWIICLGPMEESSSLTQNLMQICCSTCSAILNVTATQYTCLFNSIYCSHGLVQWSHHCLHTSIPAHSSWWLHQCCANLSHYINNGWTYFWTGHMCVWVCVCVYTYTLMVI